MDRRDFLKTSAAAACCGLLPCAYAVQEEPKPIQFRYRQYDLELRHTWTIARGSRDIATILLVELECQGIVGVGESALSTSARYGETQETVMAFFRKVRFPENINLLERENVIAYIDQIEPGNYAAKAALDIAIHDWIGKKLSLPTYQLWGLDRTKTPKTSFSIGLDTLPNMLRKVEEAQAYPILKIKVGKENDEEIIAGIRKITQKPIRVDANEAWKDREVALAKIQWMQDQGIEFIEQPMPASQLADTAWLRERVNIPIIADESVGRAKDIRALADAFDGINIKLMKCGGLHEAVKMIAIARSFGMKIMMGCMIESSVGITAAAHISPWIDYADLDGNLLISNDPYEGVLVQDGKLILTSEPGLGLKKRR